MSSSIIAKRRAANREKMRAQRSSGTASGAPKLHSVPSSQCASLYLRRPAENKASPSPLLRGDGARLNPWDDLVWKPGKLLGGEADSRVWKARLYPLDKDPFVYSLHWAYAVYLTAHPDPAKIGWYAIAKGRDPLNATKFEYGPCETADRAKHVTAEWLEDRRVHLALVDGEDELGRLTQGAFLSIICGAPGAAASVARGM
jgi:hypothetical protein